MALSCAAVASGAGQAGASLSEAARRLKSGSTIFVLHGDGAHTEGQFVRLTPDAIVVSVHGVQRMIPVESIHRIDRPDSVRNGAIIGGVLLGLLGMEAAGASCSPRCASAAAAGAVYFGAIGAGVGALVDHGIKGRSPVYIAGGVAPARPSLPPAPVPSRVLPPNAPPTPPPLEPVSSLEQLFTRVAPNDKIDVLDRAGASTKGRFVSSSSASVTLFVDNHNEEIATAGVRRVSRIGHYAGKGALVGLAFGAAVGVATSVANNDASGFATMPGAMCWGAVIGWTIPKRTVVYDSDVRPSAASWQFIPLLAPSRTGLLVARTF